MKRALVRTVNLAIWEKLGNEDEVTNKELAESLIGIDQFILTKND